MAETTKEKRSCKSCGKTAMRGAKHCHNCGGKLDGSQPAATVPAATPTPAPKKEEEPKNEQRREYDRIL